MAVSPGDAEHLAAQVADEFGAAEQTVMGLVRDLLTPGLSRPGWARARTAASGLLRRALRRLVPGLRQRATAAAEQAVAEAHRLGDAAARRELELHQLPPGPDDLTITPTQRLARALTDDFEPVYARILRQPEDVYREVIARASEGVLDGQITRRRAAQRALDDFADRGITGFVDSRGGAWNLHTYVEMAVRTVCGRAAIQAHADRLTAAGHRLVSVSAPGGSCPLCTPWEGKILELAGPAGKHEVQLPHATDPGRTVTVQVAGSLMEARAAGFQHPNCRHSVSLYLPGVSVPPTAPANAHSYDSVQEQRRLERQVRRWKRREQTALDDDARTAARRRIRGYQADLRQLTRETGQRRLPEREQITYAH
ncbi:phage minor capsid protein [Streptomyces erythrochromogenes]|uniref:phage minor capsid protein n=1 Tax=Streptomyces erythrochromogenes TaxID=285574 RepID=UPI0022573C97|nr:phage minor capsid protein [Streptomyces erythrochromogenes]MCX5587552.1 phage minor capsid protein [Streptomyces erythrochromogenes]